MTFFSLYFCMKTLAPSGTKIVPLFKKGYRLLLSSEPTCVHARWALNCWCLSVCLAVTIPKFIRIHLVSYLTQVSDLDLAPDPGQFVASPPVRLITL